MDVANHQKTALLFDGLGHPARVSIFMHLLRYQSATIEKLSNVTKIAAGVRDHIKKMIEAGLICQSDRVGNALTYVLNRDLCVLRGGVLTIHVPDSGFCLSISGNQ